jgi:hypothetical protein
MQPFSANRTVCFLGDNDHSAIHTLLANEMVFFAGLSTLQFSLFSTSITYSLRHSGLHSKALHAFMSFASETAPAAEYLHSGIQPSRNLLFVLAPTVEGQAPAPHNQVEVGRWSRHPTHHEEAKNDQTGQNCNHLP